jgi:predicted nucleic acid-binding Zn ribbon protein
MGQFIQTFLFVIIGIFLLWFGYTLFFGHGSTTLAWGRGYGRARRGRRKPREIGYPGAPRTCPVCSTKLDEGELVKSAAFPSFNGKERLMHIRGCVYCLNGERDRVCPVCGAHLKPGEVLIARMFERPRRSHVHVLGCSRCRGPSKSTSTRASP